MFLNKRISLSFSLCLLLLCCAIPVMAEPTASADHVVPSVVKFTGTLSGTDGKPLTGAQGVTFLLYKEESGGAPLWMETQNVQADKNGHYSVMLGSANGLGLPAEVFMNGEARWLAVQVGGQTEDVTLEHQGLTGATLLGEIVAPGYGGNGGIETARRGTASLYCNESRRAFLDQGVVLNLVQSSFQDYTIGDVAVGIGESF